MPAIRRPAPLNHPSVWKGAELAGREDWDHVLSDEEREEANRLLVVAEPVDVVAPCLSGRLLTIRDSLEQGCGAALIHGLDVSAGSPGQWADVFQRLASVVGTPVSQSADGQRIFSVRNAGYDQGDPRARGPNTNRRLGFHTDRCDVIGFLCLQPAARGGANQVVSSPALFNEIGRRRPDLLQVLQQPFCYKRHNVDPENRLTHTWQPVFSVYQGQFAANFLRVLIERADADPELPDLNDRQREALDFLESVAEEPAMQYEFSQQRGDMLFLNNWVTFHRRSAFEDHREPERRRHILRVWLSMPNSREIDPAFAGNYGNTAAGALRGGIHGCPSGPGG